MESPNNVSVPPKKVSGRTKAALWLMIAPTALLVLTFVLYAGINWVLAAGVTSDPSNCTPATSDYSISQGLNAIPNDEDCSTVSHETSIFATLVNIFLFLAGVIGVLSWLPGLVIGIVLLATKPRQTT